MVLGVFLGILFAGMLIFHISLFDIQLAHVNRLFSRVNLHVLGFGMTHLGIKIIHSGLHIHLEVHIVGGDFVGIDFPGLARLLVGVRFLLLGLIAHFGLTALEGSITHIHLVLVQVNLGPVDIGVFHVHIQIHRAIVGLDLALGTLERCVFYLYFLVQQRFGFHIAFYLIGLEQRVPVLVDDLDIGSADVERELHPHVAHADVHAGLFAGILGSQVGGFVLYPRDICGKRQCRHHAQDAAAHPGSELGKHISLFAKHALIVHLAAKA